MAKPARVEQPAGPDLRPPGAAALEERIDQRRAAEGLPTSAEDRRRVEADMRAATAGIGPKMANGLAAAPRRTLSTDRFEIAQARRNVWDVIAQHGTAFEDLLDPRYWTNVGPQLKQWDHIEVRCEDGSFYAELIVEDRGARYAKVAILNHVELQVGDPEGPALPAGYEITYKGPHTQWCVIRDGEPLRDKFPNLGSAQAWLNEHLRAVAR